MGIKQLPSGRWRLQIRRAKLKVDETYETREDAIKAMERLMASTGGTALKPRGITVDDAWTMYVESRQHLEKSENTQRGEITHSKPVLKALGHRPVKSLTSEDVDDFITKLTKAGKAADTIRNAVSVLSAVLNFCVKKKIIPANVTIGVSRPAIKPKVRRMPEGHQGALMKVLTHPKYRFRAVARLALLVRETGARPGEWVKATWEDIDLAKQKVVFRNTKYKGMPRTVPLTNAAMVLLNAQLQDVFVSSLDEVGGSDWIFPTHSRDGELVPLQYTGTMRDMKKHDLIPKSLRTHDGRHEFISTLVESSDLEDSRIMSLVGHHSPASMQIYAHARNMRFLPQLEKMEEIRRPDRARELAASAGVPVGVVEAFLAKTRKEQTAAKIADEGEELLYEAAAIEKIQQAAKLMGETEAERMATYLRLRAAKRRGATTPMVDDGRVVDVEAKASTKAANAPAKTSGTRASAKQASSGRKQVASKRGGTAGRKGGRKRT